MKVMSPFEAALPQTLEKAAPGIKNHFAQKPGIQRYQGVMQEVWRKPGWQSWVAWPFLKLGRHYDTLLTGTGFKIPFELENVMTVQPDGRAIMTWKRSFHFEDATQCFDAFMIFAPERRHQIIDFLGKGGHLEVELEAKVEDGAMLIKSGRQWLWLHRVCRLLPNWRVHVPACLTGQATVREWQNADATHGIEVRVHNPILGDFFGYRGNFAPVSAQFVNFRAFPYYNLNQTSGFSRL